MSMFCHQCQEAAFNKGCTIRGVCGKQPDTAGLQDVLIYALRGLAIAAAKAFETDPKRKTEIGRLIEEGMFATITNANFDNARFYTLIRTVLQKRDELVCAFEDASCPSCTTCSCVVWPEEVAWMPKTDAEIAAQIEKTGWMTIPNEDIRALKSLLLYGMKGVCAYADHAAVLGYSDEKVHDFLIKGLVAFSQENDPDKLTGLVLECGNIAVATLLLLDKANTSTYGHPEMTSVNIGVKNNPGILISGHDLKDLDMLLKQTQGTGIDIYTHSEMLPANSYPAFKKYSNLVGNYGGSWWHQDKEFPSFNGPILMTTNCIVPVKETYKNRIFTSGMAGYPGVKHITAAADGSKDFSEIIALAKTCPPPTEIETGTILGGFAHNQILALADKVVGAVKSGAVKRFVVMAGCDGRQNTRQYFTDVASGLPNDTIILTAGCAKYRYNKLKLGDIGGIPRVLDAGQCNDSCSLVLVALKLKEVFGLDDINQLPISYDIGWYEQKAVAVLLALLALGVKDIRLGPTLPAFLSPNVATVLVKNFGIKGTADAQSDIAAIIAGK
jgi:hydroxylamine reductase